MTVLERHYTVAEVATALGKDPSTIRRMVDRGEFPGAVDVGEGRTSYRIPASTITAYLDAHRVTPIKEN